MIGQISLKKSIKKSELVEAFLESYTEI